MNYITIRNQKRSSVFSALRDHFSKMSYCPSSFLDVSNLKCTTRSYPSLLGFATGTIGIFLGNFGDPVWLVFTMQKSFWIPEFESGRSDGSFCKSREPWSLFGNQFSIIFARSVKDSRKFAIVTLRKQCFRVWNSYPNISYVCPRV